MNEAIQRVLRQVGDQTPIETIEQVSGGEINAAFYVQTSLRPYFIKGNEQVPAHFFKMEAKSLELIRRTETIRVPDVHHYDEPTGGEVGMIVMDWIDEQPMDSSHLFGQQLALMHKNTARQYGFGESTFVGTIDQPNEWRPTWLEYYRDFRLRPQLDIAIENQRMIGKRRSQMESLIERLDEWIPPSPEASLLHGDLWGGNWMTGPAGQPYLIDPTVVYGDHAFEIAFTELFGGFSPSFYQSYQEVFPLPDGYQEIKPLYQLFYLLVHLNIFGESYGPSIDRILERYIGGRRG